MAVLPNPGDQLFKAHIYNNVPSEVSGAEASSPKTFHVAEGDYHIEGKKCTVYVDLGGLESLTCALNVERFMMRKSQCQWIKVIVYVDDVMLPEVCEDYKYTKEDIKRSEYELLSPNFNIKEGMGTIQMVVKTSGPGKKWPDYVFQYQYRNSPDFPPATLHPAPFARTAASRHFRDVVKKKEVLIGKFMEIQYTAEDRIAKERLQQEEEAKRIEAAEMERQRRSAGNSSRKPHFAAQSSPKDSSTSQGSKIVASNHCRHSSFDEKFDDLCRGAMQSASSTRGRKSVSFNEGLAEVNDHQDKDADDATVHPSILEPRYKKLRADASGKQPSRSTSVSVDVASVAITPTSYTSLEESVPTVPPKLSLPIPLMRNRNISHHLNTNRRQR